MRRVNLLEVFWAVRILCDPCVMQSGWVLKGGTVAEYCAYGEVLGFRLSGVLRAEVMVCLFFLWLLCCVYRSSS